MDKSLIGSKYRIYYIGDSKYYPEESHPTGVPLYKQFTYARNAIQYNIDQIYFKKRQNPNAIRYRDNDTEGYNITPNFFVSPKIEPGNLDFSKPSFAPSNWKPTPNKHFVDRLFDRDTLLLREYNINLVFLIAAYGAYENCWASTLRKTIREDMIGFLNELYDFYKIKPRDIPMYSQNGLVGSWKFTKYFRTLIEGKAYREDENSDEIILAFEKTSQGNKDYTEIRDEIKDAIQGGSIDTPVKLMP